MKKITIKKNAFHKIALIYFLFILVLIVFGYKNITSEKETAVLLKETFIEVNPLNWPFIKEIKMNFPSFQSNELKDIVHKVFSDPKIKYGVVIKNQKTNEYVFLNEHEKFYTGSLYKLWVMALVLKQIDEGLYKYDTKISAEISDLNKNFQISKEFAEKSEGVFQKTVDEALVDMITVSDNYSALLLTQKAKVKNLASFLVEYGFDESKTGLEEGQPYTTAYDIYKFFDLLYNNKLAKKDFSQKMQDFLSWQKLNSKLPRFLPKDLKIAHKTGEIGTYSHDAGIVYSPQGDYVIVVLTESAFPQKTNELIGRLSLDVYNYFAKNK